MESPRSDTGISNKGFHPEELLDLTDIVDLERVDACGELGLSTNLFNSAPTKDPCVALARKMSIVNHENMRRRGTATPAVEVRGAMKSYSSKRGTSVILNDFNMTVQEGSIYSLLGSSGCGKTTLLSCCVGVKNLDKGQIKIFGHKPGSRGAGVPGRNVGYMPQEIALYPELSINEVLLYFGRMFGMSKKGVKESIEFLLGFLNLPPPHRRIGSLSGGQQRRVSFAVALVHSPKLLILDEPTVGVDPLLRQSIWNHLVKLVSSGDTTVIITTHYVEEARQSNTIGLMRHGRLLTEDSPEHLLHIHASNHLEEIVLKLCLQDTTGTAEELEQQQESTSSSSHSTTSVQDIIPDAVILSSKNKTLQETRSKQNCFSRNTYSPSKLEENANNTSSSSSSYLPSTITFGENNLKGVVCENGKKEKKHKIDNKSDESLKRTVDFIGVENNNSSELEEFHKKSAAIRRQSSFLTEKDGVFSRFLETAERIQAMVFKNVVTLLRNIPFLLFMFFMPAFQVIMVCITIGPDPKGLNFGLVNFDGQNNSTNCTPVPGCVVADNYTGSLSCRFLDILGNKGTLKLNTYDNEEDAKKDVELAKTWGYILFHDNYTQSMKDRALFGTQAEPEMIYGSRIKFRLDQSNLQIYRETAKVFLDSFKEYMKAVSEDCGVDPIATEPPIYFAQPIYGADSVSFTEFLAPSILLAIIFFFPLCGSGIAYITEKKIGTLSRSLVAGVTAFEIMSAYLVVQLILLCIQVAVSFLILELVFHVKFAGPIHCAYLLAVMVGVAGMSMGFLLAVFLNDELQAVLVALGTFLPNIVISGLLWPLEGMPLYLQHFSKILPCTYAGEAMRSILSRGVGYTHPTVWPGFLSVFLWIVLYWSLNILFQKYKAKN